MRPEPKFESTDLGSAADLVDVARAVTGRADDLALRERGAGSLPRADRTPLAPACHLIGTSPRPPARASRTRKPKSESTNRGSAADPADVARAVTGRADVLALRERGAGSLPRAKRALHAPASHPNGTSLYSRTVAPSAPRA